MKYSIFLSDFLMTRACSRQIFEKSKSIKFHETSVQWKPRFSRRVGAQAIRNFANAPNETGPRIAQSVQGLGYGLDNLRTSVRFPAGVRDFTI